MPRAEGEGRSAEGCRGRTGVRVLTFRDVAGLHSKHSNTTQWHAIKKSKIPFGGNNGLKKARGETVTSQTLAIAM